MRTRSSSDLHGESSPNITSSNPKRRNRRCSKQPFILEESPVDTLADQRTMAELLHAPTEGYAEAIVVPSILAEQFKLKHSLINMMTSDQFFRLEKDNPHDHIRWLNKITSTIRYKDVPNSAIKLMLFLFSLAGQPVIGSKKNLCVLFSLGSILFPNSLMNYFPPQERQISVMKFLTFNNDLMNRFMRHGIDTKISFVHALIMVLPNCTNIAKLTHAVNQQTSVVTTAITAILKQFQATPPLTFVKAVEEICVTCGDPHSYYQYLAVDGNTFLELRDNIQGYASMSNQTNELKNTMASFFQMNTASTLGLRPLPNNTIAKTKGELKAITTRSGIVLDGPSVPIPHPFINPEEDARVEETLTDPKLAKEKLLELANTSLNENCSAVIIKKLPEKLRDPGKFLIPCGFSELKCKALADLGASINLMLLSVRKKLGLPELISTRMTLELANQAICTPAGIVRDVFVPIGKFTFPADFFIVDYESDPRVPLILGRPFLQTARALIDVHGEEIILRDDLFATNHQSGNLTFSSHLDLTSPKVKDDIFDLEGGNVLIVKLLDLDSTKDLPPPHNINPLSGSTTSSSPNQLLEEFTDELNLITFLLGNDDLPFDIESNLKEIEYLLNHDPIKEMDSILRDSIDEDNLSDLNDNLVDTMPEMCTDEHALDYSSPPLYDEYDDDLDEFKFDNEYAYYDPFDSNGEKINESKILIDELDLPRSSDFLPSPEYDSFLFEDFSEVNALPSTNNEDKVFNLGILIQENLFEVITHVSPDKNVKKIAISHASLILEEFDPPLYELPFHKEVPRSETLLSFSSENEEKIFKPRILTSKGVHASLLPELSHRGTKAFKVIKILESPMEIFPCSSGEDSHILDVPCLHFSPS
nr:reverse transcriptase domain-containing protein [Tanacetum cinerariifolium]